MIDESICGAIVRLEHAVERRRDFGHTTDRAVTTLDEGLRCTTDEGRWSTVADLPPALGGGATAPTPGVLLRAALGSCLAMGYRMRAARHGIELTSLRVVIETDSEIAGMVSCNTDTPAGFTELRCLVEVETAEDAAVVRAVLDEADRLSPLLDVISRRGVVRRTTSIRSAE